MNWLAHAFLSPPDVEFRLGNLLADMIRGRSRAAMSARFLEGVRHHQAIDAFTDTHRIVSRSRGRIGGRFGHANGILIDIFYDHFLAVDWERYSHEPLDVFTESVYVDMRSGIAGFPDDARQAMVQIADDDRLGLYRSLDGIEDSLRRVSKRLARRIGKDLGLERGIEELVDNFEGLQEDFHAFFPDLYRYSDELLQA
ncbi:MAG: ACP phosphodiesterase [Planctomycetota bacterium]